SETYGQVVSEALWCGLPVVAMDDGMGVAGQVTDGEDGFLVDPKGEDPGRQFGGHIELLVTKARLRRRMSEQATRNAKDRSDPDVCVKRYLEVFEVRWAGMHSTLAAMGLMRKPVELNRNHAATGTWTFSAAS
ncbi:MAG: glycosyltransferase, partial [Deltaproteobacteria bacterium]|nr:glycosyltransferase [Deltaproteobacteria bacterium]